MTGLTEEVFQALLPYSSRRWSATCRIGPLMGNPARSRRYSTYETCPLPTMADKLLFILTYLKQNLLQEIQGQLFGMSHFSFQRLARHFRNYVRA